MRHLDRYRVLKDNQNVYRSRPSCETQLTTKGIASQLRKEKGQVDVLLLDFSKALIKSPRASTPQTTVGYWIRGQTLQWIKYFLLNRSQNVIMEGCKSPSTDVILGVPQGTALGPQLFLVFMNDLLEAVQSSDAHLFADDFLLSGSTSTSPASRIFFLQIRAISPLPYQRKRNIWI